MNFQPNINESLIGVSATPKLFENKMLYDRNIHSSNTQTFKILLISVILFITIISIYDVIKNMINNHYSYNLLKNPKTKYTKLDINRTLIQNNETLSSSITFSLFCILILFIFLFILFF